MGLWIGVDVGGTKVQAGEVALDGGPIGPLGPGRAGLVADRAGMGTVVRTASRRTPGRRVEVGDVEDALTAAVSEVAAGRIPDGVGLAAAGFVDAARERVMFAPHLPWLGDAVRARLEARWGVPVALDNDANCAAVAEAGLGAAVGAASAVVITMGTGIGGALLLGGRVVRGTSGMAGEFGHQRVVPDGRPCECGLRGCWEQYASGNALERHARERLRAGTDSVLLDACGGDPDALTGPMVTGAALEGDRLALASFASVGEWLGVGLAGLVGTLDPAVVVVGGGVAAAGDLLLEPARETLRRHLVGGAHRALPPVVAAATGPAAGVIGAAMLARSDGGGDRR